MLNDRRMTAARTGDGIEDERLSLILSRAFLLADDASITDPTIVHQIKRGA